VQLNGVAVDENQRAFSRRRCDLAPPTWPLRSAVAGSRRPTSPTNASTPRRVATRAAPVAALRRAAGARADNLPGSDAVAHQARRLIAPRTSGPRLHTDRSFHDLDRASTATACIGTVPPGCRAPTLDR
jgi:hypothetical protein